MEIKTTEEIYYDVSKHTQNEVKMLCNRKIPCALCDVKWVRVDDVIKWINDDANELCIDCGDGALHTLKNELE